MHFCFDRIVSTFEFIIYNVLLLVILLCNHLIYLVHLVLINKSTYWMLMYTMFI